MDHPSLQSALREMHRLVQSRRLWATFLAVLATFIFTGPFGTSESMRFADRLLYWTVVQTGAWGIAIAFSTIADHRLADRIDNMLARMMIGSLVASLPIGLMLTVVNSTFSGSNIDIATVFRSSLTALPLCAIFCILSYLTAREKLVAAPPPPEQQKERVSLLDRLPPQKRGELLRISVQDHYTEVVTTRGRELILLRFADALKEISDTDGLQVHRSHWISDADVAALKKLAGRLFIVTRDGSEIPVSRPYASTAQARFANRVPIY